MFIGHAIADFVANEKSLTVATWGLVVATLFLFFDSLVKGKAQRKRWEWEDAYRANEQNSRWEREDRLREEDAKPKATVEIAKRGNAPEIVFRCFNLGGTIFFIHQVVITANRSVYTSDLVGPPVLLPGTFISTTYDPSELVADTFQEANAVFVLRGSRGLVRTEPVWFHVFRDAALGYGWTIGRLADRLPGNIVSQPRSIPEGQ
jgi:hypothetical protein